MASDAIFFSIRKLNHVFLRSHQEIVTHNAAARTVNKFNYFADVPTRLSVRSSYHSVAHNLPACTKETTCTLDTK